jgi:putative tributyrin esterase
MSVRAHINFAVVETSDPVFESEGLRQVTVSSPALNRRGDVTLFVPPQAKRCKDIPVFILLHGVYGSHWAWAMKAGAHRIAARMIDDGDLPPCVLAMPSDGLWGGGSGYVRHDNHDPERWIVDEVPAIAALACTAVSVHSRVCIGGLSMGGFGALRLAGKYPRRFCAAAAHSAITQADQLNEFTADDRSRWSNVPEDTAVLTALQSADETLPFLHIDCGTEDPLIGHNRVLHADLLSAGITHRYEEHPGGHEWPYWAARLPQTLLFFASACERAKQSDRHC